jgi:hypothetical protein
VREETAPRATFAALARATLTTSNSVLSPTAPGIGAVGVESVMAAPEFTQPMYESLRDLSQEFLLPGVAGIEPNTVVGLKTNQRFVESYMVGLNVEMARELLWRGYPTDQRGTYFKHFWGKGVPNTAPVDIPDLHTWGDRALDDAALSPLPEEFVMMMRSTLLQRYPNASIYLTPAVLKTGLPVGSPAVYVPSEDPLAEKPPIFSGTLQPDMCFFGFDVTGDAATGRLGGNGYFVVIQEHPTEPRFGLDVNALPAGQSHLAIGAAPPATVPVLNYRWGRNAAHMAGITRRLPVRIAIHASQLLSPPQST